MANPIWPANLPTEPLEEGTEITSLRPKPIATTMEDGVRRQRRRSTVPLAEITLQFMMDDEQVQALLQFVCDTLNDGVQRFDMPVWKPGRVPPIPLRTVQIIGGADAVRVRTVNTLNYVALPLLVRDY